MYKLGIIGYGKMGSSIINGVVSSKLYNKEDILVYDLNKESVINDNLKCASSEQEVFENCLMLILAVKPQTFPEVMEKLTNLNNKPKCVISIAAGITINYIKKYLNKVDVVRVMPNLGASINMAVSTMAFCDGINEQVAQDSKKIFESIGSVTVVSEDKINILLPMNGSYPAYFWYFIRSFMRSAMKNGIKEEEVRNMLADASIGCAKMLKESKLDIDTLIDNVCSYKGTTIEGVYVFDEYNLDEIIDKCSQKCTKRAYELEK